LAPHSWYGIGGRARYFLELADDGSLPQLIERLNADRLSYLVIGAATNTLFAAAELPGLTIKLATKQLSMDGDSLSVSAGYPMPKLAAEAARGGRAGLEFAAGVPGTVGGSVFGNAGAFGGEV
jgi:UDP-N-acetylmuramate dehydrogenase